MEFLIIFGLMLILGGIGIKNDMKYESNESKKNIKTFMIIGLILVIIGSLISMIKHNIIIL